VVVVVAGCSRVLRAAISSTNRILVGYM